MPHAVTHSKEVGFIEQVKHYLIYVRGLPSARVNDLLVDDNGNRALVNAIYEDKVEAFLLDRVATNPGIRIWFARENAQVAVGEHLFGTVVDGLGRVIHRVDQKTESSSQDKNTDKKEELRFNVKARGIDERTFITEQLYTGFSAVDLLIPIGKGQRELIFGSIDSGKERFIRDVIANQKDTGVVCIYAAIGKPSSFTTNLIASLSRKKALGHTIILSALSTSAAPTISIAPSTAFMMAEHFANEGRHVLLVLDDLGVHAEYLREIALLAGRVPGRESYPGDIFYQHAHLMERAGRFNEKAGNGSITLFPVMETNKESFADLIPTNLMASTDGHLIFSADQHTEGIMPAVSITESVTRIGHHTQTSLQRALSTRLTNIISEYPRQQEYSRFGTTLSDRVKKILTQGEFIYVILNQEWVGALEVHIQVMLCSLAISSLIGDEEIVQKARVYRDDILDTLRNDKAFAKARERAVEDTPLEDFLDLMELGIPTLRSIWQT